LLGHLQKKLGKSREEITQLINTPLELHHA
jgi:hypothetical protein